MDDGGPVPLAKYYFRKMYTRSNGRLTQLVDNAIDMFNKERSQRKLDGLKRSTRE
jgi:hypothetical protein